MRKGKLSKTKSSKNHYGVIIDNNIVTTQAAMSDTYTNPLVGEPSNLSL